MKTERKLTDAERQEYKDKYECLRDKLKQDKKHVEHLLLFVTDCVPSELLFIEDYFTLKSILPTIKGLAKEGSSVYTLDDITDLDVDGGDEH